MCRYGKTITVRVKIPADLSHDGGERWANKQIDFCIANIVQALQRGGISMRHSCCGHDKGDGDIILQDGRRLLIKHHARMKEPK